ncbi:kinase-like domain-containing protein, partial [Thermothelomyces heterothallicus CBS 202.75]|uniref:kinase-like domain-containing protein n=1 Tax=Thermothelomyces heterothallicus CBS 202.75 TaxID=1149848 RepID=UPI00374379CB
MTLARRGEGSILPTLNHPHIIRTFGSEGWGTSHVEIVLNLMDGNLASLAEGLAHPRPVLAKHVLCQMLKALDYLSVRGYVHRDVKPDNIFFVLGTGASPFPFHFRLGDFGLCEHESRIDAGAVCGTTAFMAPEL